MSDENVVVDREALAREIWAGEDIVNADPALQASPQADQQMQKTQEAAKAEPENDPWAGVPAALREEFNGLRSKVDQAESLETRLKQAERRLGAVQGELHAAKEAAKAVPVAPSQEQVAIAEQTKREWDEFSTNFPEMASATEKRLTAELGELRKLVPDQQVVRRQISEELESHRIEMGGQFVAMKHPDWAQVRDSDEFQKWHKENGQRDSMNPLEVIAILDDYKQHKASQKTPKQIEAERQQRLEQSQVTEGRNMRPVKSEADMSPAELRAAIAKQVWSN